MTQEAIDREVEQLKKFSSFQDMARWSLDLRMEYDMSIEGITLLTDLAALLRNGEGAISDAEKELYAKYEEELERIKERYHG